MTSTSNTEIVLDYAYLWRNADGSLNWDKSLAFWTEVFNNTRPRTTPGFQGGLGMLAAGEVALYQMSAIAAYFQFKGRGAPVAITTGMEVPSNAWCVGILKNAPHPNAATIFADFLTSAPGQVVYADAQGTIASSPEAAKKAKVNLALAGSGLKTFEIPAEIQTSDNTRKSAEYWAKLSGMK